MKKIEQLALFMLGLCLALPVLAKPHALINSNDMPGSKLYVASTGPINVTFISSEAAYSDDLFVHGSSIGKLINNHTAAPSSTYYLGSFEAGVKLISEMFDNNNGHTFFTGPAERNPDNKAHAIALSQDRRHNTVIGFEDLFGKGNRDYNDPVFSVRNTVAGCVSPVPEPETYGLMLAGLLLIEVARRRKRN